MDLQMNYDINKELAECYLFMSDYNKAEEYYMKAAELKRDCAAPYIGLATVAVQRGDFDKAIVLYKKAGSVEVSDKAFCGVGLVYMETGRHEEAYTWFKKSLDITVTNMVALNCFVREAYTIQKVETTLDYLARAAEESPEGETIAVTLAGCLIYLKRPDEARELLSKVLAQNPHNDNAKELVDFLAA